MNLITVHMYTLSSFTELLAIAAHVSSTIVAALFVVNDWSCDSYWYIFGFCRYAVGSLIPRPLPTLNFHDCLQYQKIILQIYRSGSGLRMGICV